MNPRLFLPLGLLLFCESSLSGAEPKPRAVLKPGKTIVVGSLAFSPDGKALAASVSDNESSFLAFVSDVLWGPNRRSTVQVLDVASGKKLASSGGYAYSGAFSPDGKSLAIGGDARVQLWDWNGRERRTRGTWTWVPAPDVRVWSVAFTPDGKRLATASGKLKLWDIATRKELMTFKGDDEVYQVVFSPDGKTLASRSLNLKPPEKGESEGTVKLWDTATGKEKGRLKIQLSYGNIAFSPDGKSLAVGGHAEEKVVVTLWDVATRKKRTTFTTADRGTAFLVTFTPNGKFLASGDSGGILKLWDVATGKELASFKGHTGPVYSVVFTPDGKALASGSEEIKLWDVAEMTGRQKEKGRQSTPR